MRRFMISAAGLLVIVCAGAGLTACSTSVPSHRMTTSPVSSDPTTVPSSIGGDHFESTGVRDDAAIAALTATYPVTVWFEQHAGGLTMVAASTITYDMPVSFSADTVTPDPTYEAVSANGCVGIASACREATWLGHFITKPLRYSVTGDLLTLNRDGVTIELVRR